MRVKEIGRGLWIEGIPFGNVSCFLSDLGILFCSETINNGVCEFQAESFDFLLQRQFLVAPLNAEVAVVGIFDFLFDGRD